jgi:acyl-CoA thioesterase
MSEVMGRYHERFAHCVTVTSTFLSTSKPGKCTVKCEVVKEGRNYAHVLAHLTQEGNPILLLTGIFGTLTGEATTFQDEFTRPNLAAPSQLPVTPNLESYTLGLLDIKAEPKEAEILARLGATLAYKSLSRGVLQNSPTSCWMALSGAQQSKMHFGAIPLLADFPAKDFISWIRDQMRSSNNEIWDATISLTIHFHRNPSECVGRWVQLKVASPLMTSERHEMSVQMWDEEGNIIATSTQLQTIKIMGNKAKKARL